jgi:hypothetical protein
MAIIDINITTPNLQEVTDSGNTTNNDIEFTDNAGVLLENTSRLREGTIDSGAGGGIAQICAVGYELKWEAGSQYVMDGNGTLIREVNHKFNIIPDANNDSTQGFYVGSRWILDNGDTYVCTDSTATSAVWEIVSNADWNATTGSTAIANKPTIPSIAGLVPETRNLTINGVTYDLSADRSWVIAATASTLQHEVKAGEAMTKGQAVYVSGADGTNMIVSKASNVSEPTSSKTMGLIIQNLATNGKGYVITEGLLTGLNTASATAGDPVWLGTNGNLIYGLINKPAAPAHLVFIGIVTRANVSNGEIFVRVQNGFELQELHNVSITSVTDNDLLQYDSATSLWKNESLSNAGVQASLVSGTNIKTVNGNSLLGSGDITISGGGSITVGTTAVTSGTIGRIFFQGTGNVVQQSSSLFWDNTNSRLGVGATPASTVRLDVRAQGALSTDIGFRVRNSADTANLFDVQGDGIANVKTRMVCGSQGMTDTGGALFVYAGNSADFMSRWFNTAGANVVSIRTVSNGGQLIISSSTGVAGVTLDGQNSNALTLGAGRHIVFDTGTGTKIGTATTEKFAFWNKTPIVQPTTAIAAATFVTNTSGILNDSATFDGYTIGQVVKALRNVGILA